MVSKVEVKEHVNMNRVKH